MTIVNNRPGRYRELVRIERKLETLDSWGQETEAWTELITTRASIDTSSVNESEGDDQTRGVARAKATMRFVGDIRAKDRLVDINRGETWDIQGVNDVLGMRSRLEINLERKKV